MIPTIIISIIIAAVFFAIVGKGIYNRKHHKSGCSGCSGCGDCHSCGAKIPQK